MRTAPTTTAPAPTAPASSATIEARTAEPHNTTENSSLNPLLCKPLREPTQSLTGRLTGVAIGSIVGVDEHGVQLALPGLHESIVPARLLCELPQDWANRPCAVLFEGGDPARPLVMGLLLEIPPTAETMQTAPLAEELDNAVPADKELHVDGERVVIQADQELELRCGESVILLQRDGRIEIRGNYITSQATATQRLRGGSIHMN